MPYSRYLANRPPQALVGSEQAPANGGRTRPAYATVVSQQAAAAPLRPVRRDQATDDVYPSSFEAISPDFPRLAHNAQDARAERMAYPTAPNRRSVATAAAPYVPPTLGLWSNSLGFGPTDLFGPAVYPRTAVSDRMTADAGRAFAFYAKHRSLFGHDDESRVGMPPLLREDVHAGRRVVGVDQTHLIYVCPRYADLPVAQLTAAEWADLPYCMFTTDTVFGGIDENGSLTEKMVEPIAVRPTPSSLHIFSFDEFLKWWIVRGTNPITRAPCLEGALMRIDLSQAPA